MEQISIPTDDFKAALKVVADFYGETLPWKKRIPRRKNAAMVENLKAAFLEFPAMRGPIDDWFEYLDNNGHYVWPVAAKSIIKRINNLCKERGQSYVQQQIEAAIANNWRQFDYPLDRPYRPEVDLTLPAHVRTEYVPKKNRVSKKR